MVASNLDKLKARLAKAEAAANKAERQKQAVASKLSKAARSFDAHLKIVVGAIALTHAETAPEFGAELNRVLNRTLWRDDEREALGLDKLPAETQEARKEKRPTKAPRIAPADSGASASLSDGSAPAPAAEHDEDAQAAA